MKIKIHAPNNPQKTKNELLKILNGKAVKYNENGSILPRKY